MIKYIKLWQTIRYLKYRQIYFRIYYILRAKYRIFFNIKVKEWIEKEGIEISFNESISSFPNIYQKKNKFTFLNLTVDFGNKIDWNYTQCGKLWTYNLNYFDYLYQDDMDKIEGLRLIKEYVIDMQYGIQDGLEPFPISLRGINWIKFLTKYQINDAEINGSLYAQYLILIDNLEYHILGNHLLENGFSLLFGGYYFDDEVLLKKANEILFSELEEQVLPDGGHYELSPMYHQIMLFRILDCINLIQNNNWEEQELLSLLINKAEMMFGWLNTITYENGDIPLLNDSTNNIAPTTKVLNEYAEILEVKTKKLELKESGYRKIKNKHYEMIVDVGNIGPDYIPGHAHSDTFNFELYVNNKPVIVDTGLSTYETNDRRQVERSTKSHNTVVVDSENQSEVWGGFRVARRAKIVELKESPGNIKATHDGYIKKGILHTREFITQEEKIIIIDSLNTIKEHLCVAYIHFHPNVNVQIDGNALISKYLTLNCSSSIELIEYYYSPEFNTRIKAQCVRILFHCKLEIEIEINK